MLRKNVLFTLLLALLLGLSLATAALAADIDVLVDGNAVKTPDEIDENDWDDQPFCLDVPPEVREGRVFVPLRSIYDVLALSRGAEVAEPERYGYNADIGDYHDDGQFVFYDAAGSVLADFTLYRITFWPPSPPEGYTAQLVLDNQTNQWYLLDAAAYARLQKWRISFDWELVEDTVA